MIRIAVPLARTTPQACRVEEADASHVDVEGLQVGGHRFGQRGLELGDRGVVELASTDQADLGSVVVVRVTVGFCMTWLASSPWVRLLRRPCPPVRQPENPASTNSQTM